MRNNPPSLFDEESKLIRKLKGILPNSKTIKDMTKVWLVKARLSPLSRENTLVMVIEKRSTEKTLSAPTEKCPTEGGSESSTKRKKRMAKKAEKGTSSRGDGRGSTPERDRAKAKEPTKVAKPAKNPEVRVATMKELCKMGGRAGDDKQVLRHSGIRPPRAPGWVLDEGALDRSPSPNLFLG
ncbi:hypothetical protein BHE74_00013082 [Ensete ventricosum]|nr:hypothetical protein BHE74_00013082 [Ensete ventricosum]